MAEFITTKGAAHHLEQIISGARKRLTLISPYLQLSDVFLERLQDAERRGVTTTIVYGKEDLRSNEHAKLGKLKTLRLRYLANLHAKCYFNETDMIITSMNMYESSEKNREMGVRLAAGEPAFEAAVREAESIIAAAQLRKADVIREEPPRRESSFTGTSKSHGWSGLSWFGQRAHCIRCATRIRLDASRPLCDDCYDVWAVYGNADYKERFCHKCGRSEVTSMRRPLCFHCYVNP